MFPAGIIASIQPRWNSAFNSTELVASFAVECAKYAVALRVEGAANVEAVGKAVARHGFAIPIIGLVKHRINELNTLITPTFKDAETIMDAGADYVAMECTARIKYADIEKAIGTGVPVIADIGDFTYCTIAYDLGVCAITTALSGYIEKKTHPFVGPDVELVKRCCGFGTLPVIAEGRYRTPKQLEMAREAGAHAVCIGNAVHEPRTTILHSKIMFDGSWKELAKNDYRNLD